MKKTRLALGADHGGYELKNQLIDYIRVSHPDFEILDFGTNSKESVDYPDYAKAVAKSIQNNECDIGILCCGTGLGISMAANRYKCIRAAVVYDEFTAQMAKEHNNANILCLGGRTTPIEKSKALVDIWLNSEFQAGRHKRRTDKLDSE